MKTAVPPEYAGRLRALARVLDTTPAEVLAAVLETGLAAMDAPDGPLLPMAARRGPAALARAVRRLKRVAVLIYRAGLADSWNQSDGETLRGELAEDLRRAFAAINRRAGDGVSTRGVIPQHA